MDEKEIRLIRELCHQVDLMVSSDIGTTEWEFLDRARLKMNDLLYKEKWREAERLAYAITLMHSGQKGKEYLSEQGLG